MYASGADLQSINPLLTVHPLAKAVQKHVLFVPLAAHDRDLRAVPRLASWTWSADRRAITFHLRTDVAWHDGVPTRARDVVWTLEMARRPEVAYPRVRELETIAEVRAVDSVTVLLRFTRAQPIFPDVLTDLAILPAHRFDGVSPAEIRGAPFNREPLGNGPFEFVEYRPNQRWVFRARQDFPADLGKAQIAQLVVTVVDEPATKLAALTSGELDFAGISPAHASFVRRDPRLTTIDYPVQLVYALVWNLRRPPFDDLRVRRAMTMALDRRVIVEAYLYGFGRVAHGPVAPDHPWYAEPVPVTYDPAGAASLLESAGWTLGAAGVRERDGRTLAFELLTVGSGDAPLEQMIQAQLAAVGIDVRIRLLELSSFLARIQSDQRDFDAVVTGIPGDLSLSFVAAMFEGSRPGPLAYSGFRSAEFDAAMARARAAVTETALREAWRAAQQVLARELPTTWLYHARGLQGATRRIEHTAIDLRGELAGIADWRLSGVP